MKMEMVEMKIKKVGQTNTTSEDFTNMLDSYGWEKEGHEVVVAR
jgi:hypothetical protein